MNPNIKEFLHFYYKAPQSDFRVTNQYYILINGIQCMVAWNKNNKDEPSEWVYYWRPKTKYITEQEMLQIMKLKAFL